MQQAEDKTAEKSDFRTIDDRNVLDYWMEKVAAYTLMHGYTHTSTCKREAV